MRLVEASVERQATAAEGKPGEAQKPTGQSPGLCVSASPDRGQHVLYLVQQDAAGELMAEIGRDLAGFAAAAETDQGLHAQRFALLRQASGGMLVLVLGRDGQDAEVVSTGIGSPGAIE